MRLACLFGIDTSHHLGTVLNGLDTVAIICACMTYPIALVQNSSTGHQLYAHAVTCSV